ncbi:MAG: HEPN domain-containing protein [Clostridiales bacterium]|nr:HEPN domain-containing protein [Clostridiales bacterium]
MDDRHVDLSRYRLEKAESCLHSARILYDSDDFYGAANRSYYAFFNAVRAILALDELDFSRHSGVISYFQREYVKTGIFDKEYSKILMKAFDVRSDADYDDYYFISEDEVKEQIDNAQFFLDGVSQYVEERIS